MQQRMFCLALWLPVLLSCNAGINGRGGDEGDGGTVPVGGKDAGPTSQCTGLQCNVVDCRGKGTGSTTISGVVNIPAGNLPLYNATVYVPNAKVAPIPTGPSCDRCDNPLSGDPLVMATTDVTGHFQLKNVPVGQNIPLVITLGKWRREVSVPSVTACADTAVSAEATRLPRTQAEGNIPRIALTTGGADAIECLLRKLGLADSEFTPEGGTGRVNLFAGHGGTNAYQGPLNNGARFTTASDVPLTNTGWWSKLDNLKQYDILVLSCEGDQYLAEKSTGARQALVDYINGGGRVFASHWHNGWIQGGPAPINSVATFFDQGRSQSFPQITASIDTSFDQGKVLSEWLFNVGASMPQGSLNIINARNTVQSIAPSLTQRYVYYNDPAHMTPDAQYFSFNAPIGSAADKQCGRMVFTDMHVSGNDPGNFNPNLDYSSPQAPFPKGCVTTSLSPQEKALIFLLFDLTNCVQPVVIG